MLCHRLHAVVADRKPLPTPRQLKIAYKAAHAADPRPDETYCFEDAKPFEDSMHEHLSWSCREGEKWFKAAFFGPKTVPTYVAHFLFAQGSGAHLSEKNYQEVVFDWKPLPNQDSTG